VGEIHLLLKRTGGPTCRSKEQRGGVAPSTDQEKKKKKKGSPSWGGSKRQGADYSSEGVRHDLGRHKYKRSHEKKSRDAREKKGRG